MLELQVIIGSEYLAVFGKPRRERDQSLNNIDLNEVDWAYFDRPKWER